MADRTGIAWCDSTWNPWIGCARFGTMTDQEHGELIVQFTYRGREIGINTCAGGG